MARMVTSAAAILAATPEALRRPEPVRRPDQESRTAYERRRYRGRSEAWKVRQWGRANGWSGLGVSGRLPAGLYDAYRAAHKGDES